MPRSKRRGMPEDELYRKYPAMEKLVGPQAGEGWRAAFDSRPDIMHSILGDIIKYSYARPGRVGQRPMPREEDVDVSWLLDREPNQKPITEVLPGLMKVSAREFARRIHMSKTQFQRVMSGEIVPDLSQLVRIAEEVDRPAVFFVEYRNQMLVRAFVHLIESKPDIAVSLYGKYVGVDRPAT